MPSRTLASSRNKDDDEFLLFGANRFCWYLPQTGGVLAVPLQRLVYDAFHMTKCYGAVFAVEQQGEKADLAVRGLLVRVTGLVDSRICGVRLRGDW